MANIHLIIGSTGAGKSTYSRLIAERHAGVRFAIDEWMLELFGPDRPDDAGYDFYAPRIERSTRMIWSLVLALAAARVPSVLEIGLTTRAAREAFYRQVKAAGLQLSLHCLEAPAELRWQRVEARNQERGPTYAMAVTRDMFDFVEGMWEPPDEAELRAHGGERVDASRPFEPVTHAARGKDG
jgi:predicted kinase